MAQNESTNERTQTDSAATQVLSVSDKINGSMVEEIKGASPETDAISSTTRPEKESAAGQVSAAKAETTPHSSNADLQKLEGSGGSVSSQQQQQQQPGGIITSVSAPSNPGPSPTLVTGTLPHQDSKTIPVDVQQPQLGQIDQTAATNPTQVQVQGVAVQAQPQVGPAAVMAAPVPSATIETVGRTPVLKVPPGVAGKVVMEKGRFKVLEDAPILQQGPDGNIVVAPVHAIPAKPQQTTGQRSVSTGSVVSAPVSDAPNQIQTNPAAAITGAAQPSQTVPSQTANPPVVVKKGRFVVSSAEAGDATTIARQAASTQVPKVETIQGTSEASRAVQGVAQVAIPPPTATQITHEQAAAFDPNASPALSQNSSMHSFASVLPQHVQLQTTTVQPPGEQHHLQPTQPTHVVQSQQVQPQTTISVVPSHNESIPQYHGTPAGTIQAEPTVGDNEASKLPPKAPRQKQTPPVVRAGVSKPPSSFDSQGVGSSLGFGKVLYFLDQMKQEVTEADRTTKTMQKDSKFLKDKNKELEAKCRTLEKLLKDEKSARKKADMEAKALRKTVRELKANAPQMVSEQAGISTQITTDQQVHSHSRSASGEMLVDRGSESVTLKEEAAHSAPASSPESAETSRRTCDGVATSPDKKSSPLSPTRVTPSVAVENSPAQPASHGPTPESSVPSRISQPVLQNDQKLSHPEDEGGKGKAKHGAVSTISSGWYPHLRSTSTPVMGSATTSEPCNKSNLAAGYQSGTPGNIMSNQTGRTGAQAMGEVVMGAGIANQRIQQQVRTEQQAIGGQMQLAGAHQNLQCPTNPQSRQGEDRGIINGTETISPVGQSFVHGGATVGPNVASDRDKAMLVQAPITQGSSVATDDSLRQTCSLDISDLQGPRRPSLESVRGDSVSSLEQTMTRHVHQVGSQQTKYSPTPSAHKIAPVPGHVPQHSSSGGIIGPQSTMNGLNEGAAMSHSAMPIPYNTNLPMHQQQAPGAPGNMMVNQATGSMTQMSSVPVSGGMVGQGIQQHAGAQQQAMGQMQQLANGQNINGSWSQFPSNQQVGTQPGSVIQNQFVQPTMNTDGMNVVNQQQEVDPFDMLASRRGPAAPAQSQQQM